MEWVKSSYSNIQGNCLEVHWTKPSYSQNSGGNCIECRASRGQVLVRDTQHRHLGHLEVSTAEWGALLGALRRGELT